METTIAPPRRVTIEPDILKTTQVDEKLDIKEDNNIFRITWTPENGNEIDIKEIGNEHLANLVTFLIRNGLKRTVKIIIAEGRRRVEGSYPPDFEELIQQYKQDPETWRLKIYSNE